MADTAVPPATPSVAVQVAFDQTGVPQNIGSDYDSLVWTDITAYVRPEPALTFNRGRAATGEAASAGQLEVTVLNDDGDFTPGDNGGTYGAIHPRMPIRVLGDAGGYDTEYYGSEYASTEVLWVGFVTDIEWKIDSGQPLVTFTASDIIAAAARTSCGPWLDRRMMTAAVTDLVAYWPLTDPAPNGRGNSSNTAVPLIVTETLLATVGSPLTMWGTGGDLSCNVPTGGISPDNQPNIACTPNSTNDGISTGVGPVLTSAITVATEFAVSAWLRCAQASLVAFPIHISSQLTHIPSQLTVYTVGGTVYTLLPSGGGGLGGPSGTIPTSEWFHFYIETDGTDAALYINGELVDTASVDPVTAGTHPIHLGGSRPGGTGAWSGQIAHVAVWDSCDATRVATVFDRGTGLPTAAERFADLVYLTNNPTGFASWLDADSRADRTVTAQATSGKSLLALAQEVADAERGSVVADRQGRLALLSQRGNAAGDPVLTLSAQSDILSVDGLFGIDDADSINEATVTLRPSGRAFTSTRGSDPGVESVSVEMWSAEDALAQALADSLANRSILTPRAPSLTVSMDWMAHAGQAASALLLELGDVIELTDLPVSAPAASLTIQVRAISHDISRDKWEITVDTDPPLYLGVLDDATYGVLDDTLILGV